MKNKAHGLGGNYVVLENTNAGTTISGDRGNISGQQTDVTHMGNAYSAPAAARRSVRRPDPARSLRRWSAARGLEGAAGGEPRFPWPRSPSGRRGDALDQVNRLETVRPQRGGPGLIQCRRRAGGASPRRGARRSTVRPAPAVGMAPRSGAAAAAPRSAPRGPAAGGDEEMEMSLSRRTAAEFLGTFWLVLGGCGSAVLSAAYPRLGIGFLGVAIAFGLSFLTMAYAVGHISGAHFNPAVTLGLIAGGRFPARDLLPYVLAQIAGAIVAAGILSCDRQRRRRVHRARRVRVERLWRALARRILALREPPGRDRPHVRLRDGGPRRDRARRAARVRADRHRARAHGGSPHRDPGHEHVGQPGALHRSCPVRRRRGAVSALALLARPARRRRARGRPLSGARGPEAEPGRRRVAAGHLEATEGGEEADGGDQAGPAPGSPASAC